MSIYKLGYRSIDLEYDKERGKRLFIRELKFYLDYTTNLRKISKYRPFPYFLHLKPLNVEQRECLRMLLRATRETVQNRPNVAILNGIGGSGKSTVINAFCNQLVQEGVKFFVCSASASASQQFKSFTVHTLCGVWNCKLSTIDMINLPLSGVVKERLRDCQLIIVDEFSLMGARLLSLLLHRVSKAKNTDSDLSVSLVFVGDSAQLGAVAQYCLWEEPRPEMDVYSLHGIRVFKSATYKFTLTVNIRQASDAPYASLLSRLHSSTITEDDLDLLESRRSVNLSKSELETFKSSIRLFSTNMSCRNFNYNFLLQSTIPVVEINPILEPFCELCKEKYHPIYVGKGVLVTLLRNIVTPRGLFNGSSGCVSEIYFANKEDTFPQFISISFNDYEGTSLQEDRGIPIVAVIEKEFCPHQNTYIKVKYFPLVANYCMSIHKSQSRSFDSCVISFNGIRRHERAKKYTALSRVKTAKGLVIVSSRPIKTYFFD